MFILRPELSNLVACEVKETLLTLRSTTGALAHLSLFIIVRRAQGPVTAATGARDRIKKSCAECYVIHRS